MTKAFDVIVPEGVAEKGEGAATISVWLYEDGAVVSAGALIAQLTVEKAEYEVDAPQSGVLKIMAAAETTEVYSGDLIARILSDV